MAVSLEPVPLRLDLNDLATTLLCELHLLAAELGLILARCSSSPVFLRYGRVHPLVLTLSASSCAAVPYSLYLPLLLEQLLLHPFDLLQHLLFADSQLVSLGCQLLQFPLLILLDCAQLLGVEVADVSADLFLLYLCPQIALFPLL